jgi:hypothetical protein
VFLSGAVLMAWNLAKTFAGRRTVVVAPPVAVQAGAAV